MSLLSPQPPMIVCRVEKNVKRGSCPQLPLLQSQRALVGKKVKWCGWQKQATQDNVVYRVKWHFEHTENRIRTIYRFGN
ncbi:hypothetical protein RRG08_034460 [Elysia crispata]|uniref:Uncharacterized protein n=1 Tax=Elysia crispata TaxID=231223 RepID=A0AAE1CL53_9GAST|nr:hypothetical protein RRG08_034460 [Elysia crispata]